MPIRYEKHYTPEFCQAHPDWLVVFGDNLKRYGKGGQAIIRNEPNAVGIPTKRAPGWHPADFFTDADLGRYVSATETALHRLKEHLWDGGTVVLPQDGLGTGRARLGQSAPVIWHELNKDLHQLRRAAEDYERSLETEAHP